MPLKSVARPVVALLYGATFWGVVWFPIRWLEQHGLSGLWITLVGFSTALLCFLPFAGPLLPSVRRHPVDMAILAAASGWTNVAFVLALIDGGVARVLLLFYLNPVWATLLGWLVLGERISRSTRAALPLGLAGGALMLWHGEAGLLAPWGTADWLALTSGMAFALANTVTRRRTDVGVRAKTMLAWAGVAAMAGFGLWLFGGTVPTVTGTVWGVAALLGICGFMITTLLVIYGVSRMPVQRSALILLFEILVGGVSAWLLAGELLSVREWVGGALILIAGLLAAGADRD